MAQCAVHALKGLACRVRATPASSPASHCKQRSVLTSPSLHARADVTKNIIFFKWVQNFSMGPILRHPGGTSILHVDVIHLCVCAVDCHGVALYLGLAAVRSRTCAARAGMSPVFRSLLFVVIPIVVYVPRAWRCAAVRLSSAFHACGSASPFCACCCHDRQIW